MFNSLGTTQSFFKYSAKVYVEIQNMVNNIQSTSFSYLKPVNQVNGNWNFYSSNIPGNDVIDINSNSQLWTNNSTMIYDSTTPYIPISHYTFDIHKVNGQTVFDEINESPGMLFGNATIENNLMYPALTQQPSYPFQGNGYLQIRNTARSFASLTPIFTGTTGLTFSFWIDISSITAFPGYIFQLNDSSGSSLEEIHLRITGTSSMAFVYKGQTLNLSFPVNIVGGSFWRHIVIAIDSTFGNSYAYHNSEVIGILENNLSFYPTSMTRKFFTVGGRIFISGDASYNARISDFRVYNNRFTQSDVTELYYSYANINNAIMSYPMTPSLYTGTTIYDESGTNSLTLNNGATFTTSSLIPNNYVSLVSASSQFITVPPFQSGAEGMSISILFRSNSNPTGTVIFDFSNNIVADIGAISTGNLRITVNGTQSSTGPLINDGTWKHVVVTFTNAQSTQRFFRTYINGSSVARETFQYPLTQYRTNNFIGKSSIANSNYFNGDIGDFRIYNRVLTDLDIQYLYYTATKDVRLTNNIGSSLRYTFDSGRTSGTNSVESVNSSRTVTLSNQNMFVNDISPTGLNGYLSFSNQYSATINTDISYASARSVSILMKKNLSNNHNIIYSVGNTAVSGTNLISAYLIMGTLNNVIYFNMNNSAVPSQNVGVNINLSPGWQSAGTRGTFSGFTFGDIALTADETTLVFTSGYSNVSQRGVFLTKNTGSIYSTFSFSNFTTPVQIGDISFINLQNVAMSCSGEIIVVTQRGGYVYRTIFNGTTYTTFQQTADTTSRIYTGLGMTSNGSRIACSTDETTSGGIFIADWNPTTSNYNAFTQVITNSTRGYDTMCLSIDGSKIAYSTDTSFNIAVWNGSGYTQQPSMFYATGISFTKALNMKFSLDTNVIHMTTNHATIPLQCASIRGDGSYNNFSGISGTASLINQKLTGLFISPNSMAYICVDNSNGLLREQMYYGENYRQHSFYRIPDNNWHNYLIRISSGNSYNFYVDGIRYLRIYAFNSNTDPRTTFTIYLTQNFLGRSPSTPLSFFDGFLTDVRFYNTIPDITDLSNSAFYRIYNNTILNTYDFSLCYSFSPILVSGSTVSDTATESPATINGTASVLNTRDVGGFLSFTSGYLQLPSITVGTNGISITFWYFASNNGTIFEVADSISRTSFFNCVVDTSNSLFFTVKNNTIKSETRIIHSFLPNRFVHVAWNLFANGTWQVILNGSISNTISGLYPTPSTYSLAYFGAYTNNTNNLVGGVTDIRFYNKTLSTEYINQFLLIKHKKYMQYFADVSMSSGFTTQFLLNNTTTNTGTSGITSTLGGNNLPYIWYSLDNSILNSGTEQGLNATGTPSYDVFNKIYGYSSLISTTSSSLILPTISLNTTSGFTILFWFYRKSSGNETLLSFNNDTMKITSNEYNLTFTYNSNSVSALNNSINAWNHIGITLSYTTDNTSVCNIYLNGVLTTTQGGFEYPTTTFSTNTIASFNGNMNDFRIYQGALQNYEVLNIYNSAYTTNTLKNTPSLYLSSLLEQNLSLSTFTTPTSASGFSVSYWLKHEPSASIETIFGAARTASADYFNLGILNNALTATIGNNLSGITFTNSRLSASYDPIYTVDTTLTCCDVVISADGRRLVFTSGWATTGNTYVNYTSSFEFNGTTSNNSVWAPVKRITGVYRMMHMAITSNGNRFIISQSYGVSPNTGYLYLSTWNESINEYNPLVQITNTITDVLGISMTYDGNMLVTCSSNNINMYNWNSILNTYALIRTTQVNNITTLLAVALTPDGSKISYSDNNNKIYYSLWNNATKNFNYNNDLSFNALSVGIRNLKFSHDGTIIYASLNTNATSSVYYGIIYSSTTLTSTGTSICSANQDTFGLYIDGFGNIYTSSNTNSFVVNKAIPSYTNYRYYYKYAFIPNNKWNHYVHTFSSGTMNVYINGQIVNSLTSIYPTSVSRSNNFIGNAFYLSKTNYNGAISDFRIYNSVLTSSNILPYYYGFMYSNNCKVLTYPYNTINSNEVNYNISSTEIAIQPSIQNAIYAVWTSTITANIIINVKFGNYDISMNGIGIQIFKVNANNTINSVLYTRNVTTNVLTNYNNTNYLTIPSINTSISTGDKIYCRIDANNSTINKNCVLNITISV